MRLKSLITVLLSVLLFVQANAQTLGLQQELKKAEAGDAQAQFNLGVMYADGTGVVENDQEAVKWWRLAAEQGLAGAQFNLGFMYAKGEGVAQNDQEAVKWYRLAAEQGLAEAQLWLGMSYSNGLGVAQNFQEAYVWFSVAAAQGYERARVARDEVRKLLSPQSLELAQVQATRCFESNFKDCD